MQWASGQCSAIEIDRHRTNWIFKEILSSMFGKVKTGESVDAEICLKEYANTTDHIQDGTAAWHQQQELQKPPSSACVGDGMRAAKTAANLGFTR